MKTHEPEIIARTREQESHSDDGVWWWKEFRLRKITSDEYYRLHIDAPYQEWLLEERYLFRFQGRVYGENIGHSTYQDARASNIQPDDAWRPWNLGKTAKAVVWDALGDTSFLEAISLSDIHRELAGNLDILRKAEKEAYDAEKRYNAACESVDDFKRTEERLFHKRHGHKRHGHKTGEDYDKALERTKKRLMPRLEQLRKDMKDTETAWKEAVATAERLKKELTPGNLRYFSR